MLALAVPLHAQGRSDTKGKGHQSAPPSSSALPSPITGPAAGASPLAWLDDASLLAPGAASVTIGISRWSGTDLSEVSFPIVDATVGLAKRFQIGASVPHIVGGADGTEPVGGVGTSYITSKIALLTDESGVKLAVSPLIEVLGEGAVQALAPGQSRSQFGLPVSAELTQGPARIIASTGFFSRGVWFAGGGVTAQATPKVAVSLSFTRSWASDTITGVSRDRRELSGGGSYAVTTQIAVYSTLARTVATTDDNGAGTTIGGGVSVLFNPRFTK